MSGILHRLVRMVLGAVCGFGIWAMHIARADDTPPKTMWSVKLRQSPPPAYSKVRGAFPFGYRLGRLHFEDGATALLLEVVNGGFSTYYPELREGHVVPMFGLMYRVRTITLGTGRDNDTSIEIEWIDKRDLPSGVSIGKDSRIVPLHDGRQGRARIGQDDVHLTRIDVLRPGEPPFASVTVTEYDGGNKEKSTLRPGELLKVGAKHYRVRNIVPADKERNIIGWLELAPQPVEGNDDTPAERLQSITLYATARQYQDIPESRPLRWRIRPVTGDDGTRSLEVNVGNPASFVTHYPALEEGDLVPMFGFLYRVRSIRPGSAGQWDGSIALDWVAENDLPSDIRVRKDSHIVPLHDGRRGQGAWHGREGDDIIVVQAIHADGDGSAITATVKILEHKSDEKPPISVRRGDFVTVRGKGYQIREITPPDKKDNAIGWVEVDPKPTVEARKRGTN